MTLDELRELTDTLADEGVPGNAKVLGGYQPTYPLLSGVTHVIVYEDPDEPPTVVIALSGANEYMPAAMDGELKGQGWS